MVEITLFFFPAQIWKWLQKEINHFIVTNYWDLFHIYHSNDQIFQNPSHS